jgi:hypothetical protein
MALRIVNPQPNYPPVKLIEPAPLGYLHVAAVVDPPRGRIPFPGNSPQKAALLTRLTSLVRQLERLSTVEKATVYRAILIAPPSGYAKQQPTQLARYDVVVLIETTSPEVTGEVQTVEPYKLLVAAVQDAARDVHMMAARCVKRVADVDKTRQGLFLFNYFVADDAAVALQLWDYLAGWYAVETGLRTSTVLEPLGDADYVFVNHARWDHSVPRFMALLLHPWVGQARPGSGGHRPPSASMARLISASGEWKPNAIRVSRRSLVLTDSTSPLDRPWSRLAWMPARCSVIERASFTNAGMRQR